MTVRGRLRINLRLERRRLAFGRSPKFMSVSSLGSSVCHSGSPVPLRDRLRGQFPVPRYGSIRPQ